MESGSSGKAILPMLNYWLSVFYVMLKWKPLSMENGTCSRQKATLLAAALLLAAPLCPAADHTPASAVVPVSIPRPVLTNAIQVLELPADQLALSNHVKLRGVMTFVDPHASYGFVQDETAGAAVFWTNRQPPASAGQWVEIEGKVDANVYAPTISQPVFHQIGPGEYPKPLKVSFPDLWAGRADCQWVEVDGLVRSATMMTNDFLVLEVAIGRRQKLKVSIFSPKKLGAAGWVNSRVRIQGVACGSFNSKQQFVTAELLVPSVDQVTTLVPARSEPYSLPVTSLASLGHKAEKRPGEQIHIQGVVTLLVPGEALFVREGTNSMEVRTSEMGGVKPGDQVDVVGFYEKTDHALIIEDGSFRRLAAGPPPMPLAVTMDEIASGRIDAELVTIPAVVLEWRHGPSERIIMLQGTDNVIFKARLNNTRNIEEYPVGSRLQATGVCLIEVDQNLDVRSFELRLRSAADLVLLERAAWWTPTRVLRLLGALVAGAAMTLGWVGVLKRANARLERRVAERTEELGRSEERFRNLAACLPVGVVESDPRGLCTYMNPRGTEISGRPVGGQRNWAWTEAVHPDDRAGVARSWSEAAAAGKAWSSEFRLLRPNGQTCWVNCLASPRLGSPGKIAGYVATFADITQRKQSEAALEEAHKQLVLSSRLAGMAEVATSVLHNVGNVLTSVNISSSLIMNRVRNSKVANLGKAAALIQDHADDLPAFFAQDPKGTQLPGYLSALSGLLIRDHAEMLEELELLSRNIEHINEIVAMQQNHGKVAGLLEELPVDSLVEDALRMNLGGLERHGIQVVRDYGRVPAIQVDKHKVLQILVNLIGNAKYACTEGGPARKRIILRVGLNGHNRVKISVIDNGIGIPRQNLTQIFAHGFTTRKDGHGFGLHSGALAAKELGGALLVQSDGPGQGAVFTLELPLQPASPDRN